MTLARFVVCTIIVLFAAGATGAEGGVVTPELQSALRAGSPGEALPIIVAFEEGETLVVATRSAGRQGKGEVGRALRERSREAQREVRALLRQRGEPYRELWIVNALALEASAETIALLSARPEIIEIRLDGILHLPDIAPAQLHEDAWNLLAVGAPDVWDLGIDGTGVVVAVIDSGVDLDHPALAGRWRETNGWFNPYAAACTPQTCTPCEASADLPCDDVFGHGTAVAGIVVGGEEVDGIPIGVAPGAQWIAAKVFRDDGTASFSAIHSAFQWILEMDEPPHIVNNSWGLGPPGTCNEEFRPAIQALEAAGIAVVSAAGNAGPRASTGVSPGTYPEGLAAGALDRNLALSPFSSRGPGACDDGIFPDLAAPGEGVLSALSGFGALHPFSGTSFAAPHVAGVLALLRQSFPLDVPLGEAQVRRLKRALLETAIDLGEPGPDYGYGMGLVDAEAARSWLADPPTPLLITPPSGFVSFGSTPPGTELSREIAFFNAGQEGVGVVFGELSSPFSLFESDCPEALLPQQQCRAVVRFAPQLTGPFSATLEVRDAPGAPSFDTVFLDGVGNTTPLPAQLLAPTQGAQTGRVVTFRWRTLPDPDGHLTVDTLLVSRSVEFPPEPSGALRPGGPRPLLAGAGTLALAFGGALLVGRNRRLLGALLIVSVLVVMSACGGGSGGVAPEEGDVVEVQRELAPGTYFWKILTEDELGEAASSAVRSFTVQ